MGEIQEVAVSLASANEISFDAVALVGVFTITEKKQKRFLFFFVRQMNRPIVSDS